MRFVVLALVFLTAAIAPPEPQRTLYPPNAWPIVSTFGSFDAVGGGLRPAPNPGVDIIALVRTPVFATEHAEVTLTGIEARRGKVVELRTTQTGRSYTLTYAHLHAIEVTLGERVSAGQRIGTVGDTGQVARGIGHLHFEVGASDGLSRLDPEPFLRARKTGEIECVGSARGLDQSASDVYALNRFEAIKRGELDGAPFLYPVACTRDD